MSSLIRSTNKIFGLLVLAGIIATIFFYITEKSGLAAFFMFVITLGAIIAWCVQLLIDRKVTRQAPPPLTPAELSRFKIMRILVALALVAMIVFAVTSD